MKVAVVATGLEHITRGVESWARAHADALQKAGMDVTLLKGTGLSSITDRRVRSCPRGSRLNRLLCRLVAPAGGWRVWLGNPYEFEQATFFLGLLGGLGSLKTFDVIHLQDPLLAYLLQTAHKRGFIKARTILGFGTGEEYSFLPGFDYLQFFAPFYLDDARRRGFVNRRAFVVPHHVDTDRFAPRHKQQARRHYGIADDAFVVVCAAAVNRSYKRVHWLIEEVAHAVAVNPEGTTRLHVVVAGAAERETPDIIKLAADSGIAERVTFLLSVPYEQMPAIYALGDVFALCSLHELFGIVLIEAMASGLPIVVNDDDVFRWIAGAGGDCIDMQRRGALSTAIIQLMNAPDLERRRTLARDNAVTRFSRDVVLQDVLEMYRLVAGD